MGAGHDHGAGKANSRRLIVVICLIGTVFVAEVIGGLVTGSLALLADAGHMLSDLIGLIIALVASLIAQRPASDRRTFGYRRVEVLAAALNGLILSGVAVSVAIEGVKRLLAATPELPDTGPMFWVAVLGLVANVIGLLILRGSQSSSINMRGAYLEVLGDTLGSLAVIAAAVTMMLTGFARADAIASLVIAAMILPRAWSLLRDVVSVLLQSAPRETDIQEIREHVLGTTGVVDVHDVHVWQITTGNPVFTAHVVVEDAVFAENRAGALLDELQECLEEHFDVEHSTFQLEPAAHAAHEDEQHD